MNTEAELTKAATEERLNQARVVWIATVRPDSRPHLVPVWFLWSDRLFYICTEPDSVKAKNLAANPGVCLALEDGVHPIICEGQGQIVPQPWPESVCAGFRSKYEWDIRTEDRYTALFEVTPKKWMTW